MGDVVEALELSQSDFEDKYGRAKPSHKSDIIFHCMGGIRSRRVLDTVHELGYDRYTHTHTHTHAHTHTHTHTHTQDPSPHSLELSVALHWKGTQLYFSPASVQGTTLEAGRSGPVKSLESQLI